MKDFCECECHEKSFNDSINLFLKNYYSFLKIKGENIKTKKSFDEMKKTYDLLSSIITNLKPKGKNTISILESCHKNHSILIKEINSKIEQADELLEKINIHFEKIKKNIPEIEEDEEEEINIIDEHKNDNEKNFENMDDKQIMENDKQSIVMIQNLLEDQEYKAKNKEEKRQIIKAKDQLNELLKSIENELNHNNEQIDNIEDHVDNSLKYVDDGNDNLEKAARSAVKRRGIKYELGFAAALGLAGSVVPIIGNVVGVAVGGLVGYGVYRIDRHRLNKALRKAKKEQEERKNKNNNKEK